MILMLIASSRTSVSTVLESGESREGLQLYLLKDLRLLENLLDLFPTSISPLDETSPQSKFRLGHMGHVIIMCQAIVHACKSPAKASSGDEMNNNAASSTATESPHNGETETLEYEEDGRTSTSDASNEDNKSDADDRSVEPPEVNDWATDNVSKLAQVIAHIPIKAKWDEFVSTQLVDITAAQSANLGGFDPSLDNSADDLGYGMPGNNDDDALEISEGDLDIAVSMIEAMKITHDDDDEEYEDEDDDEDEGDTPHHKHVASSTAYRYEDPLGQKDGSLGDGYCSPPSSNEDEGRDGDDIASGDCDAPVLDLFAGNFDGAEEVNFHANFDAPDASSSSQSSSSFSATFASFDDGPSLFDDIGPEVTKNLTAFDAAFDQVNNNAHFDSVKNDLKGGDQVGADERNIVDAAAIAVGNSSATDPFGNTKVNIDEIF
jgi:hypothetical protein